MNKVKGAVMKFLTKVPVISKTSMKLLKMDVTVRSIVKIRSHVKLSLFISFLILKSVTDRIIKNRT